MKLDWEKIKLITQILKELTPIVSAIVDDIIEARDADSEGGQKITRDERQEIIIEHVLDLPAKLEPILRNL
tara:strand:+ start:47 stop:259 length:213 start_codon:yes stop_codon:yes gene_type:complete